jgi:protein TonB
MKRARRFAAAALAFAAAAAAAPAGEPLPNPRAARGAEAARAPAAGEIDLVPSAPSAAARLEQIRERVQAAVVYPRAARERGIQGVARIQFRVDPAGRAAQVTTVKASGSPMLDGAAEQAARDARGLPQLYGWVQIPVRFALDGRGPAR